MCGFKYRDMYTSCIFHTCNLAYQWHAQCNCISECGKRIILIVGKKKPHHNKLHTHALTYTSVCTVGILNHSTLASMSSTPTYEGGATNSA